ncbi:MAG TPA: flagellar protein FlaG [Petrotogaceae bacterium]|nr:flagellar protein FlaG [Petrotogaceae bacterium]
MDINHVASKPLFDTQKTIQAPVEKKSEKSNEKTNEGQQLSLDNVKDILQKKMENVKLLFNGEAKFEIDREADLIVVKIIDKESKELIRQIPAEEAVKLAKAMNEIEGIIFDQKA